MVRNGEKSEGLKDLKDFRIAFIESRKEGKESKEKERLSKCINKIMNTLSFRKLAGKTQVILSLSGPNVRTRLTHTVEVARIARDICEELGLNADLAEAIALAHDIGHTPFGHVGERTLREIMCGCDTLGDKIRDFDFANSGFKHNLQGFRVLTDIEKVFIDNNEKLNSSEGMELEKIWPFILWGVIVHTDPTYANQNIEIDNEIYISCAHCKWVYSCYFDKDHKCKRNKDIKTNENKTDGICKPWYCSKIKDYDIEDVSDLSKEEEKLKDKLNRLENLTEKRKIEKKLDELSKWKNTHCTKKCYLARLWEYKQTHTNYRGFPYLFDHPFPNSFYFQHLGKFFFRKDGFKDCVSVEAKVVSLADEIAQRQQDLEDGIKKRLITLEEASEQVKELLTGFKKGDHHVRGLLKKLEEIDKNLPNFQLKLGNLLTDFYKYLLIKNTKKNFNYFFLKNRKIRINYYCLLKIMNIISGIEERKWLEKEIDDFNSDDYFKKLEINKEYFISIFKKYIEDIDTSEGYLFFILHEFLENEIKKGAEFESLRDIFDKFKKALDKKSILLLDNDILNDEKAKLIYKIDIIKKFFRNNYQPQFDAYRNHKIDKDTHWKNLKDLHLHIFHKLYLFVEPYNFLLTTQSILIYHKFNNFNEKKFDIPQIFNLWKTILELESNQNKLESNQIISNLVNFVELFEDKERGKKEKYLKNFEKILRDTILKSEIVEKNDGKAGFILRRLFKAYITNPHQLPDDCLKNTYKSTSVGIEQ